MDEDPVSFLGAPHHIPATLPPPPFLAGRTRMAQRGPLLVRMDNGTNDYRLERWIAILLGLLFFLPFVARAEDVLATGSYHRGEVKNVSGENFLALVKEEAGQWFLQPVRIRVETEFDPIVDEKNAMTGKRVIASGIDDGILIRGDRFSPGHVTAASPDGTTLTLGTTFQFKLHHVTSTLRYRCADAADPDGVFDCKLVMATGETEQEIATFDAFADRNGKPELPDIAPEVYFAGDLDHDGKLDLLIDIARSYNEWHPALFLSSAAGEGALVGQVAELTTVGC